MNKYYSQTSKRFKWQLFKKWAASKKAWFIGTGVFLIVGAILLLVGFSITGWDLITWLKSPYATTFFICLSIGCAFAFVLIGYFISYKIGGSSNGRK